MPRVRVWASISLVQIKPNEGPYHDNMVTVNELVWFFTHRMIQVVKASTYLELVLILLYYMYNCANINLKGKRSFTFIFRN